MIRKTKSKPFVALMAVALILCLMAPAVFANTEPIDVGIDIKPFSCPNAINLTNQGTLPVAIFGYPGVIDVMEIDPATIELGGVSLAVKKNGKLFFAYEDNNLDGIMDMICHFSIPQLTAGPDPALDADTDYLFLTAQLYNGTPISGEDIPWVVPWQ
ncbi:MAG: hypothetical protein GYA42_09745 [Syntrophomonadaceae bacterium]|nr:hypothetical protein [Syntrophomonadaceae bacterium]